MGASPTHNHHHNHNNFHGHNKKVVLMIDSRELFFTSKNNLTLTERLKEASPLQLVAGINSLYAKTMGYEFVWYKVLCPLAYNCTLDNTGRRRAPSWARVLAINETITHNADRNIGTTILYLDSDAYISNHSIPFRSFPTTAAIWEDEIRNNLCSGTMFWKFTSKFHQIITDWWDYNVTRKSDEERQWEQTVLNNYLVVKYRRNIMKLPALGWIDINNKIAWDNGFLMDEHAQSKKMIFINETYNLTEKHVKETLYSTYIQHLWGGLAQKYKNVLEDDFQRLGASFLTEENVIECDLSSSTRAFWRRYCLKHEI